MKCSWAEFFGKNCRKIRRAICSRQRAAVLKLNMAPVNRAAHDSSGDVIFKSPGNSTVLKSSSNDVVLKSPGTHSDAKLLSSAARDNECSLPPIGEGRGALQKQQAVPWRPPQRLQVPH
jgi:hypothetical protein